MAYTLFSEVAEGRTGSVDQRYQRSYKRVFLVRTDSATYGPYYAGSHPSLPLVWSAHDEDANALCVGFDVSQDQSDPLLWRVTANYAYAADVANSSGQGSTGNPAIDTQQSGIAPGSRAAAPLSRARDYQVTSIAYPETVLWDTTGNAIENSAYDPFLPAPEVQKFGAQITVGLNSSSAPSNAWLGSVGKVNATTLTLGSYSLPALSTRLNNLSAQLVYEQGVSYWRWTLAFEYRPNGTSYAGGWVQMGSAWPELGWKLVLLDAGKRKFTGTGTGWEDFRDAPTYTTPVSQPVLMNGASDRLTAGAKPYYKAWNVYDSITFPSPI